MVFFLVKLIDFFLMQDTSGLTSLNSFVLQDDRHLRKRLVANGSVAGYDYFQSIVRDVCFNPTVFSPIKLSEKTVTKLKQSFFFLESLYFKTTRDQTPEAFFFYPPPKKHVLSFSVIFLFFVFAAHLCCSFLNWPAVPQSHAGQQRMVSCRMNGHASCLVLFRFNLRCAPAFQKLSASVRCSVGGEEATY